MVVGIPKESITIMPFLSNRLENSPLMPPIPDINVSKPTFDVIMGIPITRTATMKAIFTKSVIMFPLNPRITEYRSGIAANMIVVCVKGSPVIL